MGYIAHTVAVFTSGQEPPTKLEALRELAIKCFENSEEFGVGVNNGVTPIMQGGRNGYSSFAILPDGSKEGWGASEEADEIRKHICIMANHEGIDYVMVRFGGDDNYKVIIDENQAGFQPQSQSKGE